MLRGRKSKLDLFGFLIWYILGWNRCFGYPFTPSLHLAALPSFLHLPRGSEHHDGPHVVSLSVHMYFHV